MKKNKITIPDGKVTKKDLLTIIKNLNIPKQYRVDELAKGHGHIVMRLPPYYCVLNPIELVWSTLKKGIRRNNTCPRLSSGVVDLVRREVSSITKELWKSCIKHVIEIENSYVSPNFQNFIIHVNDDASSDSAFDSSGDDNN